jgi:hypothetical protein
MPTFLDLADMLFHPDSNLRRVGQNLVTNVLSIMDERVTAIEAELARRSNEAAAQAREAMRARVIAGDGAMTPPAEPDLETIDGGLPVDFRGHKYLREKEK